MVENAPVWDAWLVARAASFIALAVLILFVGKLSRDILGLLRGYKLSEVLTVRDNPAAAVDLCGFLLGLLFGLLGSLVVTRESWVGQASEIALTGLAVIACLLVADWVGDRLVFRKMDDHHEVYEKHNLALAVGKAAMSVATGLVIRGALGDPDSSLLTSLVWVLVGQVAMVLIALVYQWITPYDDLAEIGGQNLAAGFPIAGILLAVGITVGAGVHGQVESWAPDLGRVGLYLALSMVLLFVLRTLTDAFVMPGTKLAKEIAQDRNVGAGLIEGTSFVLGAQVLAYFFN